MYKVQKCSKFDFVIMAKTNTMFEELLKNCKTMRQIFECQTALADGLSDYEVLELRAKYAGLTVLAAEATNSSLAIYARELFGFTIFYKHDNQYQGRHNPLIEYPSRNFHQFYHS